ncbi:hypothetical protein RhiTH_008779 [Rhizoctonia solani]
MGQRQKAKAAARVAAAANSRSPSPKLGSDGPEKFVVPELSVKDCLSVIPPHCFERSALRSFSYVAMDFALLGAFHHTASTYIPRINPTELPLDSLVAALPENLQPIAQSLSPHFYSFARFAGWQVYALGAGLVGTGLWIIAHECGHQAFSTSKTLNNAVGWVLHSALGVPYHSWRISHARHHAATSHCTRDEAYVPRTRSQKGLPPLDPAKEDLAGGRVDEKVQEELVDALGDSPLGAALGVFALLHTDPLLPHYRQSAFTFTRGALSTMDRNLLGGEGFIASITGWLGATLTHGISETHVLHHVCSKIPHYHAWEASRHLKARLARAGYSHEGRPGTWGEVYRVWKECRFIEDEGDVVFYKNARGLAARQAVFANEGMSDSGVDVKEQSE